MRRLVLLRPDPGASASLARARALGLDTVATPLFAVEPIAWAVPPLDAFDALLLTSANALRHGGAGIGALAGLPVIAVGEATAAEARAAGLTVTDVGYGGIDAALALVPPAQRLLHLSGADRFAATTTHRVTAIAVYHAREIPDPRLPDLAEAVVAVHSARAGARLADVVADRGATMIAAISAAAAAACGSGWESVATADAPSDTALLALAARLCQDRA